MDPNTRMDLYLRQLSAKFRETAVHTLIPCSQTEMQLGSLSRKQIPQQNLGATDSAVHAMADREFTVWRHGDTD